MLAIARDLKVGTGTVQRVKREMGRPALSTAPQPPEATVSLRLGGIAPMGASLWVAPAEDLVVHAAQEIRFAQSIGNTRPATRWRRCVIHGGQENSGCAA